ncbi:MAG TPA: BPSL0067 family protein [Roseiarcus sp.]|jgi:hypothetical protein|nr:BPSL0067 family protein [Roseiarcus sp.]
MATGCRSYDLWRRVARTGKRKGIRLVQWLWPLIAPVGLGIAVACGESWADPQVVSPSGLPVQVRPTYPEPGLPAFSFPQGEATIQAGVGSGTTGTQGTSGTQGSSGTGASAATLADYQQYVGSYYGANEQCVSLTRDFDSSLPPSSQWQQGELVEGATDIAPGTPIATFNFNRVAAKMTLHDGSERSVEFLMIHSAASEWFINDVIYPHQKSLRVVLDEAGR